jgi:hypothetical protein
MRKRFLLISTIIVLSAFTFAACGKKSPSSPESTNSETTTAEPTTEENTEKDTTEEEKPVATATSEESTKTTTATKKDEQAKPKSATGTYNGFADTSSVEIEMPDGSYQTFMVNDEDLVNKLNDMDEGTKITFTYGAVEGQANMEILSIE